MARRRRPLRAVSFVFAGFVTLVLLSQLSAHFFAAAIPKHLLAKNEAVLSSIQLTSTLLAFAASALGLVFAGGVLVITRQKVAADIDVYRATGLRPSSALLSLLRSHSLVPLEWVALTATATSLVDLGFGLDALLPVGLATSFALLLVTWLGFLTLVSFSRRGFPAEPRGKAKSRGVAAKVQGLLRTELTSHAPTIVVICIAMGFAGYLATFFENASWVAAEAAGTTSPSFGPSAVLVVMATLPSIFVVLGAYALIDANEEALRYEIGVFSSQGIDGDTVVDVWSALYGWLPVAAFLVGLLSYLFSTQGVIANLQSGLPDIITGLFFITGMATLIMIPYKLNGVLDTSPYAVVRS